MHELAWVVRDELARGELVEVLPEWACHAADDGGIALSVVYAQGPGATPPLKSRLFVEHLKQVLAREAAAQASARPRRARSGR